LKLQAKRSQPEDLNLKINRNHCKNVQKHELKNMHISEFNDFHGRFFSLRSEGVSQNPLGSGNVYEFCSDRIDSLLVLKGGSWINDGVGCRVADHVVSEVDFWDDNIGFRCFQDK